jgi:hypothetical protein
MDVRFLHNYPLRVPSWRAERAMQLVQCCKKPSRWDDPHVHTYWRFLNNYVAASGDERRLGSVELDWPDVFHAHKLYFYPDREWRYILEARLLTREPLPAVAQRFDVPVGVVNSYEQLFFNVWDRFDCRDWIGKIVRGEPGDSYSNPQGAMTEQQRAKVYRWFGYHGGPLVLDAVLGALSPNKENSTSQVNSAAWCDEALKQIIRCAAATALCVLEFDQQQLMQLLKLWMHQQRNAACKRKREHATPVDASKNIEAFLAQLTPASG